MEFFDMNIQDENLNLRKRPLNQENILSKALVNAYIDGNLSQDEVRDFESRVAEEESFRQILLEQKSNQDFIMELIPQERPTQKQLNFIKSELEDVANSVLKKDELSVSQKVYKVLTKTVIEF